MSELDDHADDSDHTLHQEPTYRASEGKAIPRWNQYAFESGIT